MRARSLMGVVSVLITIALSSCGGSGNSLSVPNPTPTPNVPVGDFQLVLQPLPAISLQQGGTFAFEVVEADPIKGFKGTINLALSGLPAGVTTSGVLSLPITGPAQNTAIQFTASLNAALGASTITVTGTSGNKIGRAHV